MGASMASLASTAALQPVGGSTPAAQAGYGVSLNDVAAFDRALTRAQGASQQGWAVGGITVQAQNVNRPPGAGIQALFKPLEHINAEASALSTQANTALTEGRALTPSEMVLMTVKCHEFMFHCQLTSNVANRTSDGLAQLFRQQS
jgi:hypothetical protein